MKKTLLALLLTAAVIMLPACSGSKEDPYELYMKSQEAQKSVTSMEMDANVDMKMDVGGEKMDMGMQIQSKSIIRSQADQDMEMTMTMDMFGQAMETKMFFKDGVMYQDVMGQKVKMAMDLEEFAQMNQNTNLEFEKTDVKNGKVEKTADGKKLSFELNPETMTKMIDDIMGNMSQSLGIAGDVKMDVTSIHYEAVLGDDFLPKSLKMTYSVNMEVEGEKMAVEYDMTTSKLAYNTVDAINFPADLDSYMDMDDPTAGMQDPSQANDEPSTEVDANATSQDASAEADKNEEKKDDKADESAAETDKPAEESAAPETSEEPVTT